MWAFKIISGKNRYFFSIILVSKLLTGIWSLNLVIMTTLIETTMQNKKQNRRKLVDINLVNTSNTNIRKDTFNHLHITCVFHTS